MAPISKLTLPVILAWLALGRLGADPAQEPAPTVSTAASEAYPPVSCSGTNAGIVAEVVQMAEDARDRLGPILQLGPTWRFPVHVRVVLPDDPLVNTALQEAVEVTASGNTMSVDVVVPAGDPDAHNFIERQFVTEMVWEKYFAKVQAFDTHTRLDTIPLWLTEGLREWLDDDPEHNREGIVRRAVQGGRAPTLDEVTSWTTLSDDKLLGLWQRAFCFYLVDSLTKQGAKRDDFQRWLGTISGPDTQTAVYLFPTEAGWQRQLAEATARGRDIVYSWDETAAELAAAEAIELPAKKDSEARICTLDTVENFPRDDAMKKAVQEKITALTALELRAHPSWTPILALYRFGLTALLGDKSPEHAIALLHEARARRVAEMANHQALVDYANWFDVTHDYRAGTTHFRSYFSTAQQLERGETDPNHPNPIRDNLLQVESRL